jgi:hypothetical protein
MPVNTEECFRLTDFWATLCIGILFPEVKEILLFSTTCRYVLMLVARLEILYF